MVIFVSGALGARFFHILVEAPKYYLEHPIRVFYFWQGGFVLYGGIMLGILVCYGFLRWLKEPIGRWADVVAPCLWLGIGIGRIGCLAAGCCYGERTNWFWGMVFEDVRSGAPRHIPLHPTQALEMVFCLLAAFVSWKVFPRPTKRPGVAFVWMILIYALFRFLIEFLRGDLDRGFFFEGSLSTSQMVSIVAVAGSLIWFWYFRKKPERVS
jgi:phosphatidylglycerol:prolipoprotein diacylglycerol transferase